MIDSKLLTPYISIARPDHWFKNIFVLPGVCLALIFLKNLPDSFLIDFILGMISTCCIASANYSINEYLDAPYDRLHPTKKFRPAALGLVKKKYVILKYIILSLLGLITGIFVNYYFALTELFFLIMGFLYNVKPIRTKDLPYLDVISESINNPIRLILGWLICIPNELPPSSFILAYWCSGAYLMTLKRYAEYRKLGDPEQIASYRKSLAWYTESRLCTLSIFYAINAALFLGISLIKYRIEFIILFPFLAILFSWYFAISLYPNSVVQTPEKLYKEKKFTIYIICVTILFCLMCFIDIPQLYFLLNTINIK